MDKFSSAECLFQVCCVYYFILPFSSAVLSISSSYFMNPSLSEVIPANSHVRLLQRNKLTFVLKSSELGSGCDTKGLLHVFHFLACCQKTSAGSLLHRPQKRKSTLYGNQITAFTFRKSRSSNLISTKNTFKFNFRISDCGAFSQHLHAVCQARA